MSIHVTRALTVPLTSYDTKRRSHLKATMARKRLRKVKADLTVLSIQPGGELRDWTVCPSPGLVSMPSRLP